MKSATRGVCIILIWASISGLFTGTLSLALISFAKYNAADFQATVFNHLALFLASLELRSFNLETGQSAALIFLLTQVYSCMQLLAFSILHSVAVNSKPIELDLREDCSESV